MTLCIAFDLYVCSSAFHGENKCHKTCVKKREDRYIYSVLYEGMRNIKEETVLQRDIWYLSLFVW